MDEHRDRLPSYHDDDDVRVEVRSLRSKVDELRGAVDRARGAVWLLVLLLGVAGALLGFVVHR